MVMEWDILGLGFTAVPDVAPCKKRRIRVDQFLVLPQVRNANPISVPGYRCEIADYDDSVVRIFRLPFECDHTICRILKIDPFKSAVFEIDFIERGFRAIQGMETIDESLHTLMRFILEQVPIKG